MSTAIRALGYSESHAFKYAESLNRSKSRNSINSRIRCYCKLLRITWSAVVLRVLAIFLPTPIFRRTIDVGNAADVLSQHLHKDRIASIISSSEKVDNVIDKLDQIRANRNIVEHILLPNWSISTLEQVFIYIQELGLEFKSRRDEDREEVEQLKNSISESLNRINIDQIACT